MPQARQRYIDAATRLFQQRGYNGVSMRDLALELGIQAPSIYSHFPSKDDILIAIVMPLMASCEKVIEKAPVDPTVTQRREWLCDFLDWLAENGRLLGWAVYDPASLRHPVLGARMREIHLRLRQVIESFDVQSPQAARSIVGYLSWPFIAPWGERPVTAVERTAIVGQVEALIEYAHTMEHRDTA